MPNHMFRSIFAAVVTFAATETAHAQIEFQHHPGSDCTRISGNTMLAYNEAYDTILLDPWGTKSGTIAIDSGAAGSRMAGYLLSPFYGNHWDPGIMNTQDQIGGFNFCSGTSSVNLNAANVDRALVRVGDAFSTKSILARFCLTDPYGSVSCGSAWSSSYAGTGLSEAFYVNKPAGTFQTWHNMTIIVSNLYSAVIPSSSINYQIPTNSFNGCTFATPPQTQSARCTDYIADYVFENAY